MTTSKIKISDSLPAMTKDQWIDYAHSYYQTLLEGMDTGRYSMKTLTESITFYNEICSTVGLKTI